MHREWKISHQMEKNKFCPGLQKIDNQPKQNYRPITLLLICGKILERVIYNSIFEFFTDNEIISSNQSSFNPGDSCINQLLCITHDIYQSFDDGLETRAVFLDISKAFDKVWHEGVHYKLKQNGTSGNLLNIITNYLSQGKKGVAFCFERTALNMG